MKLYYGADKIIQKTIPGLGNPSNDYGLGFYLTPSKEAAKLWASRFLEGYVLTFEIDLEKLKILRLNDASESEILTWIALLAKHRFDKEERISYKNELDWLIEKFAIDIRSFDMIIGYRADDSYFAYSAGFVHGQVSIETLGKAMKIGKLGLQYVLISPKAFESLRFITHEKVSPSRSYHDFRAQALSEYHDLLLSEDIFSNHFIRDLMRKYGK